MENEQPNAPENASQAQAAENAARAESNPNDTGEDLASVVAKLQGENQAMKEQLQGRASPEFGDPPPTLPDPKTVSTEEYFRNRDEYVRQYGIRNPSYGLGGLR